MIPMLVLGSIVEQQLGTLIFIYVLSTLWIISVVMEVAMATMMYHFLHTLFHGCSLGFSGIVFGLLVLSSKYLKSEVLHVGSCSISFSFVPWGCLILYYAVFHRGSLFMHIGGIISGYACILWSQELYQVYVVNTCIHCALKIIYLPFKIGHFRMSPLFQSKS